MTLHFTGKSIVAFGRMIPATCVVRNDLNGWRRPNQVLREKDGRIQPDGTPYQPRHSHPGDGRSPRLWTRSRRACTGRRSSGRTPGSGLNTGASTIAGITTSRPANGSRATDTRHTMLELDRQGRLFEATRRSGVSIFWRIRIVYGWVMPSEMSWASEGACILTCCLGMSGRRE